MPVFARGGDHVLNGKVIRDARHLRARRHHFAGGAPVEADDLQDDFLFRLRERPLLIGEFEQFLIFGIGRRGRRFDGLRRGGEDGDVDFLRDAAEHESEFFQPHQRSGHAQGPELRPPDRQSLRQNLADKKNENEQPDDGRNGKPASAQRHPESHGEHRGGGEGVADHHGRQKILRFGEQLQHAPARDRIAFGQLPRLPFAEGKERRLREREKETRAGGDQDHDDSHKGRWFHAASMGEILREGKRQNDRDYDGPSRSRQLERGLVNF